MEHRRHYLILTDDLLHDIKTKILQWELSTESIRGEIAFNKPTMAQKLLTFYLVQCSFLKMPKFEPALT